MATKFSRTARGQRDEGYTLIEMLVAMALSGIVLAAVATVLVGTLRSLSVANAQGELTGSAQVAMERITAKLRAADFAPPAASNPVIMSEQSFSALTVTVYLNDPTRAQQLSALLPSGDSTARYMTDTQLVPKRVRFAYEANASACGGKQGITETVTPPRRSLIPLNQIFAWDGLAPATPTVTCVMRTTAVPVATTAPIFTYYPDCQTATETSTMADTRSIGITLRARDSDANVVELKNRICLVNAP